jgi:hypothetical protein
MNDTAQMRNLKWHIMHRHLAEAGAETGSYAIVRQQDQPHWRFAQVTGAWLSRARNNDGVSPPRR